MATVCPRTSARTEGGRGSSFSNPERARAVSRANLRALGNVGQIGPERADACYRVQARHGSSHESDAGREGQGPGVDSAGRTGEGGQRDRDEDHPEEKRVMVAADEAFLDLGPTPAGQHHGGNEALLGCPGPESGGKDGAGHQQNAPLPATRWMLVLRPRPWPRRNRTLARPRPWRSWPGCQNSGPRTPRPPRTRPPGPRPPARPPAGDHATARRSPSKAKKRSPATINPLFNFTRTAKPVSAPEQGGQVGSGGRSASIQQVQGQAQPGHTNEVIGATFGPRKPDHRPRDYRGDGQAPVISQPGH